MRSDPQYAPEHLAVEAVRRIGPQATAWVDYVRRGQPGLDGEQVAQIAAKKFTNIAGLTGAVSGAAGLPGAVVDFGVLAWTQARMVLHIAAAYGLDPAHPDRATDLLVLQRVHRVAQTARAALGVAQGRETIGAVVAAGAGRASTTTRLFGELTVKLARMAGVRALKRLFAKVVPGAAVILGHWANRSATKELAARSMAHYRAAALAQIPRQASSPE
nr:EcsC family protein [Rhizocola hellebori]